MKREKLLATVLVAVIALAATFVITTALAPKAEAYETPVITGWQDTAEGRVFFDENGNIVKDTIITIGEFTYRFDENGHPAENCWVNGNCYDQNGHMLPLTYIDGIKYAVLPDGGLIRDTEASEKTEEKEEVVVTEDYGYYAYPDLPPYDATKAQNDRTGTVVEIVAGTAEAAEEIVDLASQQVVIEQLEEQEPEVSCIAYFGITGAYGEAGTTEGNILDLANMLGDGVSYNGLYLVAADGPFGNVGDWVTVFTADGGMVECLIQTYGSGISFVNCCPTEAGIVGWTNNGCAVPEWVFA